MSKGWSHLLRAAVFACVIVPLAVRAQQDPMYTMYMWNILPVNPAYAGSNDVMNATALTRHQWIGIEGAPVTNSLMVHSPLKAQALGLGLSVIDDKIGPSRSTTVNGDFAYRFKVSEGARIALGTKVGINRMSMNMGEVPGTTASDPVFQGSVDGDIHFNFGFGAYYWSSSGYVGLAVPKLLEDHYTTGTENGPVNVFTDARHYLLMAGYVLPLSDGIKFKPSFLVRAVAGAPLSVDLTANFLFFEKLWIGATYRTADECGGILSYQITEQLRAGYAYELPLSPLRSAQSGTHEGMLSYDLNFTKRHLRSPRYF
jgi:type IX secretion system PorP/SprF family membrane protein